MDEHGAVISDSRADGSMPCWTRQREGSEQVATTVLVTGASRGIGRAICARLASPGVRVIAVGRDANALEQTSSLVHRRGGEAETVAADVCDIEAMRQAIEGAARSGGLDVVVHNAGIGGATPVAKPDFDRWKRILEVDLQAPMQLTALALPHVIEREGAFVFIGSVSAKMGMAGSGAYCAAKHGLDGFAEALFEEVREQGVRVVRIHPGYVNTDMVAGRGLDSSKMIQPADIAELVHTAVSLPPTACVVEMIVRPQRTPYR